ncbi:hypothetical protein KHS38_11815 [Mucilaginibacter sp. Bleaf8]|uniref:hypothetical protein n=1 Tax=Mucilaginibacter sp. Bleaf8 TaxID=2834430 RepID=UPI001BCB7212|nr:hypothetical protein [Mucilaginibacter sp. Bleaf8]MBS7565092.1 hypothetical protein [Mucilaginibacter sp. Bleaf8]
MSKRNSRPVKIPASWFNDYKRMKSQLDYEREYMQVPIAEEQIVYIDPATNEMTIFRKGGKP